MKATIDAIARDLGIDLDAEGGPYSLGVVPLRRALEAAYEAGQAVPSGSVWTVLTLPDFSRLERVTDDGTLCWVAQAGAMGVGDTQDAACLDLLDNLRVMERIAEAGEL